MRNRLFLLISFLCCAYVSYAQGDVSVRASIDSTMLIIGDQAKLRLEVGQDAAGRVQFPFIEEDVMDLIEVVSRSEMDTVELGNDRIQVSRDYTITSFTDSLFYIPPFGFVAGDGDTVWTESLSLRVIQPFEIDTVNNTITDIKGIYAPKIYWARVFRIILYILLLIGAVVLICYLYKKYKRRAGDVLVEEEVVLRPAYEVVMENLDRIKLEKQWQEHGRSKAYHTDLTDAVRAYVDGVYGIGSMEMTSDEILAALRPELKQEKACYEALRQLFSLADLVKFAKWNATPDEHEKSLSNAYLFVEKVHALTTVVEPETSNE